MKTELTPADYLSSLDKTSAQLKQHEQRLFELTMQLADDGYLFCEVKSRHHFTEIHFLKAGYSMRTCFIFVNDDTCEIMHLEDLNNAHDPDWDVADIDRKPPLPPPPSKL